MSAKYSLGQSFLLSAAGKNKRKNAKNQPLNWYLTFFVVMLFLVASGGEVMAGGLVDTSVERFKAADFTNSENITNPWWTLPAGHNYLYFAQDGEDCLWNPVEVLDMTTNNFEGDYAGTNARVILDRGWVDEGCQYGTDPSAFSDVWHNIEAEEVTYDWYAQDSEKNLWYMGEDTYDGTDFSGSFVAGCYNAEAGIVMLGNPSKGDSYQQEYYEDEAEDWGKVLNFKNILDLQCLKTKEWSPLEHGAVEHKFYCSDGEYGELSQIDELQGKTLHWELVAHDVDVPPADEYPANYVSPEPSCD